MRLRRLLPTLALAGALAHVGGCGGGDAPERAPARVLVVGWDGATFDQLDPLLAAGRLPHLAGLVARGRTAVLESTRIPISSAAWASAFTGYGPGETGVYGFFAPVMEAGEPGGGLDDSADGDAARVGYDVRLVSSLDVRRPPLWRVLSGRGLGVHVFGAPLTWPPEPVDGVMVTGMLSPHDGGFALPEAYERELLAAGFVPDLGQWRAGEPLGRERLERQLAIKRDALVELLARDDWRAACVVFKSLDVVGHQAYSDALDGPSAWLCQRLDAVLGQLLEVVGEDTDVLLVSDHGFRRYPKALDLHGWLLAQGFSVARAGDAAGGAGDGDATPAGPLAEARPAEHRRRLSSLDLEATRAYAWDCEGNFGSLRLNLAGREARGVVAEAAREATLAELEAALLAWVPDGEAAPAVTRVWRGTDLLPGPERASLPDLVFETRPDVRVLVSGLGPTWARFPAGFPDHALEGVLVAAGPHVAPSAERGRWEIADLAPTVLHLLDQPVYADMTGVAHPELEAGTPGGERPVRRVRREDDPTLRPRGDAGRARSPEELRALLETLQGMGYGGGVEPEDGSGDGADGGR